MIWPAKYAEVQAALKGLELPRCDENGYRLTPQEAALVKFAPTWLAALLLRVRRLEEVAERAEAAVRIWTEATSQEMYGEHIRAGLERTYFDQWQAANSDVKDALAALSEEAP
jgi:hypothetical protein